MGVECCGSQIVAQLGGTKVFTLVPIGEHYVLRCLDELFIHISVDAPQLRDGGRERLVYGGFALREVRGLEAVK